MEETVFFNKGDRIAKSYDFDEALRSAEIFKGKNKNDSLLVVREKDGNEYAVYYTNDLKKTDDANHDDHVHYYVKKRLD